MVVSGMVKLGGSALAAVPGLGSMGSAAGILPAAMNPVGAVIVGIVAAIGTLMLASKDFREGVFAMGSALWSGLQPALSSVWNLLKTFGLALWEIVKAIGDALGPALKNLAPLLEQIGKLFGTNLSGGADGASSSLGAIVPVITGVIKVIGFLLDITTKVLVPIIEIPLKIAVLASEALRVVHPLKLMGQAIEFLTGVVQKLWHWITGNSPGLIPAFELLGGVAAQVAGAMLGVVGQKFGQMVSVVTGATQQIGGIVSASWSSLASGAQQAGSSMVEGLKAGLSAAKSLGGWIGSNVTGPVVGFIKSGFGVFSPSTITITIGGEVVEGLKRGLQKAREMGGWVQQNVAGPVMGAIKTGLDAAAMTPIGQQMIAGLQQGLAAAQQMGGWLQQNVAGPILGSLKSAFGIGSPSRYTRSYGEDMVAGLRLGLADVEDVLDVFAAPSFASPLAGAGPSLGGLGGAGATINVYPQAGQDEREIAALVSRELAWASAGGIALWPPRRGCSPAG
jgi:phage-related protein